MHPLARVVVERTRRRFQTFDALEALDWIRRLDDLARLIDNPPPADAAALLDAPVLVGDVPFYRFSPAALMLIEERFSTFAGRLYDLAVAWAAAHARDPGAIRTMAGLPERKARRTVRAWARSLRCSYESIMQVVRAFSPKGKEEGPTEGPGFGSIVSVLIETYGQTAEYWAFANVDEIRQRLIDRAIRHDQEHRAIAKASKTPIAPDPDSWGFRAQVRFNKAVREFEVWAQEQYGEQ